MFGSIVRLLAFALPLAVLGGLPAGAAEGPAWPDRPVKVIVPFAPGGGNDLIARPWTEKLAQAFGQPFVIENRGGASGMIGSEAVARSAPDGYTLLVGSASTMAMVTQLQKINFDPQTSFTPIARLADLYLGFAINPAVPATTMREFLDHARANPGKVAMGTAGIGTSHHFQLELLKEKTGVDILHVPYRGSGDVLNDLLAGHVQAMVEIVVYPHAKAGKLRLLAVMSDTRYPAFPDTPTLAEAGVPGVALSSWYGLYGPAGMPPAIVNRLNKAVAEASAQPEMAKRLLDVYGVPHAQTPAEVAQALAERIETSRRIIKSAKMKAD